MSPEGVAQCEQAVEALLKENAIRQRWDNEEFWEIVTSLIVFLASTETPEQAIDSRLHRLRHAKPSLAVVPAANVRWSGPPLTLAGKAVIGDWDDAVFREAVLQLPTSRQRPELIQRYMNGQRHRRPLVGFGVVVPGQRTLAFEQARDQLETICDLVLLLDVNKENHGLYSLRGAWNRPGVRGLTLDKAAVEKAFESTDDSIELASQPLLLDELGEMSGVHWYGADPLPLDKVLAVASLKDAVATCLTSESGVYPRLRVASRWFAEAFWATKLDDAALALGVALDALIGARSGLPSRVMRERFALLESIPERRAAQANRYEEIFSVRSAVAHGGKSSRLEEAGFVRGIQDEVTRTSWRLLEAQQQFAISGDRDLDLLFDDLRWGTREWARTPDSTSDGFAAGVPGC